MQFPKLNLALFWISAWDTCNRFSEIELKIRMYVESEIVIAISGKTIIIYVQLLC